MAEALMNLNDLRALVRRVGVLSGLSSRSESTRVAKVKSLNEIEMLDALRSLARLVDDRSAAVREALAEAMVRLTAPGHEALTREWLVRQPAGRRRAWMNPMRRHPAPHPVDAAVAILRELAVDPVPAVRALAAQALGQLEVAAAAAEPELSAMLHDPDESVRCSATAALARVTSDDAVAIAALSEQLRDSDSRVRKAAAKAAALRGDSAEELVPLLVPLMADADPEVRGAAVEAVSQVGAGPADEDDIFSPVRHSGTVVLGTIKIGVPDKLPGLVEALGDGDFQVRFNAAAAIGREGVAALPAVPALVEALRDSDGLVAAAAATSLGEIGPAAGEATPALLEALGHPDAGVRNHAAEALKLISIASDQRAS
jgi:HEAT repeat protein